MVYREFGPKRGFETISTVDDGRGDEPVLERVDIDPQATKSRKPLETMGNGFLTVMSFSPLTEVEGHQFDYPGDAFPGTCCRSC